MRIRYIISFTATTILIWVAFAVTKYHPDHEVSFGEALAQTFLYALCWGLSMGLIIWYIQEPENEE